MSHGDVRNSSVVPSSGCTFETISFADSVWSAELLTRSDCVFTSDQIERQLDWFWKTFDCQSLPLPVGNCDSTTTGRWWWAYSVTQWNNNNNNNLKRSLFCKRRLFVPIKRCTRRHHTFRHHARRTFQFGKPRIQHSSDSVVVRVARRVLRNSPPSHGVRSGNARETTKTLSKVYVFTRPWAVYRTYVHDVDACGARRRRGFSIWKQTARPFYPRRRGGDPNSLSPWTRIETYTAIRATCNIGCFF